MYFYIKTETELFLRKYYRKANGNYCFMLTNDQKEAGLFFPDQFNIIKNILQGTIYAGQVKPTGEPITYIVIT